MTWVGRRGDLQAKWDSCVLLCLQWGVFQYFRQFWSLTGKPSNSFLTALASQGQALGSVLMLSTVFIAQLEKKHLLLVDDPLKMKERMLLEKKKLKGAWLQDWWCMQIPLSWDAVPVFKAPCVSHPWMLAQESSCSGEALWQHPPGLAGDPSLLSLTVRHAANANNVSSRNRCQLPSPRATRKDGRKEALRRIKN